MLKLTMTMTDGPLKGQVWRFDEPGIIRFGRDVGCDVCLTNEDLPFAEFAPFMRQILAGLSHLHRKGFVHRDLEAKISDFGLAKGFIDAGLSGVSKTTDRAGTLRFMSKEQIISTKYATPASDVWSIAATFYLMLTGQYPREQKPDDDYVDLLTKNDVIPIRQHEPSIPQAVADVIDRALQSEAEKRYTSAGFMLKALEGLL